MIDKINLIQKRRISTLISAISVMLMMFLIVSCGNSKNATADSVKEFQELKELVNSREFEIQNQWAMPLGASNINLIGNPNYIRFKKDSVDLFLPYFGIRHSGGGYNREGGIRYEGPLRELEITENESRNQIRIKFEGRQENESLNFNIQVFSNGNAQTSVTSSQRNSISYRGEIDSLPEKFKK